MDTSQTCLYKLIFNKRHSSEVLGDFACRSWRASESLSVDEVIGGSRSVSGSAQAQVSSASQNRYSNCLSAHRPPFLQLVGSFLARLLHQSVLWGKGRERANECLC